MRPRNQKQALHHFIRRWPRARRDQRGPEEIKRTVEWTFTPKELAALPMPVSMFGRPLDAGKATYALVRELANLTPPRGYTLNLRRSKPTVPHVKLPDGSIRVVTEAVFLKVHP